MTLPNSTSITERYFSVMKIIKKKLRNKMEAERDITTSFRSNSIIEDFKLLKKLPSVLIQLLKILNH